MNKIGFYKPISAVPLHSKLILNTLNLNDAHWSLESIGVKKLVFNAESKRDVETCYFSMMYYLLKFEWKNDCRKKLLTLSIVLSL